MNIESQRLSGSEDWRVWGPYLSERQWGTVRGDYSTHREAWEFVDHEASRKRAYRWGEDGIRDLVRSRGLGDVYKRQVHARRVVRMQRQA